MIARNMIGNNVTLNDERKGKVIDAHEFASGWFIEVQIGDNLEVMSYLEVKTVDTMDSGISLMAQFSDDPVERIKAEFQREVRETILNTERLAQELDYAARRLRCRNYGAAVGSSNPTAGSRWSSVSNGFGELTGYWRALQAIEHLGKK